MIAGFDRILRVKRIRIYSKWKRIWIFSANIRYISIQQDQVKRIVTPNGKINTYVLIVLPTGDANILKRAKEAHAERELAMKRAPEAFKELDKVQ